MQYAIRVVALFCVLAFATNVHAAPFPALNQDVGVCDPNVPSHCIAPNSDGSINVTGGSGGSSSPFIPSLAYGTLTATASSSASTALPTNTGTVAFQNQNSAAVSCTLASGSATATTNEIIVPAGSTIFIGTTGYSNAACINQTGSASNVIIMAGGSGLGTGFGGGSSGGGSSGAVFGPTAVGSANANPPVVIGGTVTGAAGQNVEGVAVKPASTAPVATDLAMVVTESPNSPLITGASTVLAGTAPSTQTAVATGNVTKLQSDLNGNMYQSPSQAGGVPAQKSSVPVINGGNLYNTIAASTALKLSSTQGGGTGALGDYLSHCVIIPATTSPGAITLTDGSGSAVTIFAGGSSSVSNLVPFAIPVGALSISGGWTLTTLTNESAVCYGKFT